MTLVQSNIQNLESKIERHRIVVQGIVQGVGFRPFVYGQALRQGLAGFVLNDSNGVTIGRGAGAVRASAS